MTQSSAPLPRTAPVDIDEDWTGIPAGPGFPVKMSRSLRRSRPAPKVIEPHTGTADAVQHGDWNAREPQPPFRRPNKRLPGNSRNGTVRIEPRRHHNHVVLGVWLIQSANGPPMGMHGRDSRREGHDLIFRTNPIVTGFAGTAETIQAGQGTMPSRTPAQPRDQPAM